MKLLDKFLLLFANILRHIQSSHGHFTFSDINEAFIIADG